MQVRLLLNLGSRHAGEVGLSADAARADSVHDLSDAAADYLVRQGWAVPLPATPAVRRLDLRAVPLVRLKADQPEPTEPADVPKRGRGRPSNAERYGTEGE